MSQLAQRANQHLMIAMVFFPAYLAWVFFEPTLGTCTLHTKTFAAVRITLVALWLGYIVAIRSHAGTFTWRSFSLGAASGGMLIALTMVLADAATYPWSERSYSSMLQFIQPVVQLAPAAAISGLYASFIPSRSGAVWAGVRCFAVQMVVFTLATMPITCTY